MTPMPRPEAPTVPLRVTVRGDVPSQAREYAESKIGRLHHYAHEPILAMHVVLQRFNDPARERPAFAEATLDVNGFVVRAAASASDPTAAVDLLEERLRRNVVQHQDRVRTRHRWIGLVADGQWRHGDVAQPRPEYFPLPPEDRAVVRRKTFGLYPMTPDEAAFDMELLGHSFFLFTDLKSGHDAVVHRIGPERYAIQGDVRPGQDTATQVELEGPAPVLTDQDAVTRLDVAGEPFVFYLEAESGRGRVLYRRYDGHYGLIVAADP